MYDSLEGLDYRPGELRSYVYPILNDIDESKKQGFLTYVVPSEIRVGDVCIGPFSSHLVLNEHYYQHGISIRNGYTDKVLIIPKAILEQMRK